MGKLIFDHTGEERDLAEGEGLHETCEEAGVPFACTEGVCGTCVIEVLEGLENLSEFTPEERDFLGEPQHERLACQCKMRCGSVRIKY